MTQMQLNHAVARATGESLDVVRMFGFGIADPEAVLHDPEPARRSKRNRFHRRAGGAQRENRLSPRHRSASPKQPVLPPNSATS